MANFSGHSDNFQFFLIPACSGTMSSLDDEKNNLNHWHATLIEEIKKFHSTYLGLYLLFCDVSMLPTLNRRAGLFTKRRDKRERYISRHISQFRQIPIDWSTKTIRANKPVSTFYDTDLNVAVGWKWFTSRSGIPLTCTKFIFRVDPTRNLDRTDNEC